MLDFIIAQKLKPGALAKMTADKVVLGDVLDDMRLIHRELKDLISLDHAYWSMELVVMEVEDAITLYIEHHNQKKPDLHARIEVVFGSAKKLTNCFLDQMKSCVRMEFEGSPRFLALLINKYKRFMSDYFYYFVHYRSQLLKD